MTLRTSTTALGAALLVCAMAVGAAAQVPDFSQTYVRQIGPPATVTDSFTVCDSIGDFRLVVENGPGGQPKVGSGTIAINGQEIVHSSDLNRGVTQIERPLTNMTPITQIDVRLGGGPGGTIRVTVVAVLECAIHITSPPAGSTLTGPEVLVSGRYPLGYGADVGVTVNERRALASGGRFAALVPIDPQVTDLTAVARNASGTVLSTESIAVTVLPGPPEADVHLGASPAIGVPPLSVEMTLSSLVPVVLITVDQDGDGVPDFQGPTLEGHRFIYNQPGVFVATATVDTGSGTRKAMTMVQVYDSAVLATQLQAKWQAMRNALRVLDITTAVQFIATDVRERYRAEFEVMAADLPQIDSILPDLTFVDAWGPEATFNMPRTDGSEQKNFEVRFGIDTDGIWRLRAF